MTRFSQPQSAPASTASQDTSSPDSAQGIPNHRREFLKQGLFATGAVAVGAIASSCQEPSPAPQKASPAPEAPTPPPVAKAPKKAADALPEGLDPYHFHVYSPPPKLSAEMRRDVFGTSYITPAERVFVRSNLPIPDEEIIADRDAWTVKFEGVKKPGTITLAQLKTLGIETVTCVLQCSGNGRRFFAHTVKGSQWGVGAAANVIWTGVPLRAVIKFFGGAVAGAKYVTATGGDLPAGMENPLKSLVERSIPLAKGMTDVLLAWEMNGEPIMRVHGAPLRLIAPGYYGVNNIKFVNRIALGAEQSQAKIQQTSYRVRPIGEKGAPDQPSMWAMNVKSWITEPAVSRIKPGKHVIVGVAFSGEAPVKSVEVSTDGGKRWQKAEIFGPDAGPYAWRQFRFIFDAKPGHHQLVSRAKDGKGNIQPKTRMENHRGYGNNAWQDHAVTVSVSDDAPSRQAQMDAARAPVEVGAVQLSEAGKRGRKVFLESSAPPCGTCHTLEDAGVAGKVGPNLDALRADAGRIKAAVTEGLNAMPPQVGLSKEQVEDLATYITEVTGVKK